MNIQLKEMKLIFTKNGDTYSRTITDLQGNVIWEISGEIYCPIYGDQIFEDWELQMKQLPFWNIVQVEKNIN